MSEDRHFDDDAPGLCLVCEEAPGTVTEPEIGRVCPDCYLLLIDARGALRNPDLRLAGCREKKPHA